MISGVADGNSAMRRVRQNRNARSVGQLQNRRIGSVRGARYARGRVHLRG